MFVSDVPVLVACGACGNVHDLLFMLGSSFGLTALLALGQFVLDRIRGRLGDRFLTPEMVESAVRRSDAGSKPGDYESTTSAIVTVSRSH
ncbi:MAG: hypothetical protein U0893_04025 [Chloroflexota bacterium]